MSKFSSVLLVVCFAVIGKPAQDDAYREKARNAVIALQRHSPDDPNWKDTLKPLDKRAVPELLRLVPLIEHPFAYGRVVDKLFNLKAKGLLPVFETMALSKDKATRLRAINSLDRFGWEAIPTMLQVYRGGDYQEKSLAVPFLMSRCQYRPIDRRVRALAMQLLQGDDPSFRTFAAWGLWSAAVEWHHDRDPGMIGAPVLVDREAFKLVCLASIGDEKTRMLESYLGDLGIGSRDSGMKPAQVLAAPGVAALEHDKDPLNRLAYLVFRIKVNGGPGEAHVTALADPSDMVANFCAGVLRYKVRVSWVPQLGALCKDKNPRVRSLAVELLGVSCFVEGLGFVKPLLSDPDPSVKVTAQKATARIEGAAFRGASGLLRS